MDQTCERNNMQDITERNSTQLLPAAPAGTDRRVPNGIRMGDRIEVQSLKQSFDTLIVSGREALHGNLGKLVQHDIPDDEGWEAIMQRTPSKVHARQSFVSRKLLSSRSNASWVALHFGVSASADIGFIGSQCSHVVRYVQILRSYMNLTPVTNEFREFRFIIICLMRKMNVPGAKYIKCMTGIKNHSGVEFYFV